MPECTCHRSEEELKEKGHIMGCALRTRREAIEYFEYEQALERVQQLLDKDA